MSLEALHTEVTSYRAEAGQLADEFTGIHAQVADDPNLTPTGKRERLEPLHREVTERISALHAREKAAVKSEKERLERRVFGLSTAASSNPAQIVSFRDAQARARELNDRDDAEQVYQAAVRSNDKVMAAAVLEKALVRGWTTIKDDFLERNRGTRDDLDDLTALAKYAENSLINTAHYMPPSLNLPHSAGFPNVPNLHARKESPGYRPLPDWLTA